MPIYKYGREAGSTTQRKRINYYKQIEFEFLDNLPKNLNVPTLETELDNYYTSLGLPHSHSKTFLLKRIACILGLKSKVGNWVCRSQYYKVQL